MPRAGDRGGASEASVSDRQGPTMLIGEVAAATGLTQRTLRYYEEIGLLPAAARLEGGYRLYSADDVTRLRRIVELKRMLGFSLVEVKEMLELEDERKEHRSVYHREVDPVTRREAVAKSLALARRQLATLDSRLAGLLELKAKTEERIGRYEAELVALGESPDLVEAGRLTGQGSAR